MIKSLALNNFQSHAKSILEFSSGVNVILGDTDSGKTSILRAINWVVSNRPRGDAFVSTGKKSCSVKIYTNNGSVERQKKSSFNGYRIKSQKDERSFTEVGSSVPPEVLPVLCLSEINNQSQLSSHFLVGMPAGYISKALSELLGFEFADGLSSLVKSGSAQVSKDVSRLTEEINSLDLKLTDLKRKLETKSKVDKSKILFVSLKKVAVDASTLEMLLSTYKEANIRLKKANHILSNLESVNHLSKKFRLLEATVGKFRDYGVLFKKVEGSNFSLGENKTRLNKFIPINEVPAKINDLSYSISKFSALLKLVEALKSSSSVLIDFRSAANSASIAFESGLKVFESAVDSLEYCNECLREFTEIDREVAKRLAQ